MARRVLLVLPSRTYRAAAFLEAARRLQLEVVVASDQGSTLGHLFPDLELTIDLDDPVAAARLVASHPTAAQIQAVVPVDDGAVLAAAQIAERLGLPGSPVTAVAATRNKLLLRERLNAHGVSQPGWWPWIGPGDPGPLPFPVVVKPLDQAGSRGVIRVDEPTQLLAAGERIRRELLADPTCLPPHLGVPLLVEKFVAGPEVAVEAVLRRGQLWPLAVFDKPDPLDGPYFEETVYTVPSGLDPERQGEILAEVLAAVRAVGLSEGAVHAELRLGEGRPRLIDLAGRSIGGRCSGVLRFASKRSLEEILLRAALGEPLGELELEPGARGVMMMPIPRAGTLRSVPGRAEALAGEGIDLIDVSVPLGGRIAPLPEGDRYLGFIHAHGRDSAQVTQRLWRAYQRLGVVIED